MTDYTELHTHSCYSLLDGASSPGDLCTRAAELGYSALALTDHDAVYGAIDFVQAAQKHNIRPILGAELTLHNGHHLTLLVRDATGWHNLCTLITLARHNAPKGEARLPEGVLFDHTQGLIALSGCRHGEISQAVIQQNYQEAVDMAKAYRDAFGQGNFYIELQRHGLSGERRLVDDLVTLAQHTGIQIVATNNVHYATRDRHELQDVLVCIRHNTTLDEADDWLRPNSEYYLKSPVQMHRLFADYPLAIHNTNHIVQRCEYTPQYGLQELPAYPLPADTDAQTYLMALCRKTAYERGLVTERLIQQLQHELTVIEQAGLANYFLIVWDIVRFSQKNGILCQGRGSAANSLVAYLLDISPINPLAHALVFERFLSAERQAVPDIDIDFQADRREEVIQYLYQRYGHERAAMACNLITFRARSAIRDVAKVMGIAPSLIDQITTALDVRKADVVEESRHVKDILGQRIEADVWRTLTRLCRQIAGFPRHLGIHNGGFVITRQPLSARVPTEPATMTDRYVVQWDKTMLEDAGLIKIDILGLRMLSAIAESCQIIQQQTGQAVDLTALTFDDPAVFQMITAGDTVGVFQVESRAQTQVLPRLKPTCFNDLIISISLIRPGPIQGDMVHPYLRRRLGEEPVTYFHPLLEPALKETLGVILFQEQVLKVARDMAGFTAGQGEQLRRALGAKNATDAIEAFHYAFVAGAVGNGVESAIAEDVFDRLRAFGSYSFPKSHAAAFAVLVYRSAWLKRYHPAAFYTALLNNQPMGFWSPAVLVNDAKRHGIPLLPVDIHSSLAKCSMQGEAIRLGFNLVHGMGDVASERIVHARQERPFRDLNDFCQRTHLPRRLVENLILAGAMDSWGERRRLIWRLGLLDNRVGSLNLSPPDENINLPQLSPLQSLDLSFAMTGVAPEQHVMTRFRDGLQQRGVLSSSDLERITVERDVTVAGLNVVHQAPPTAKGHHFITLEDEYGFINVIVRPKVYAQFRRVVRGSSLLLVTGRVQRKDSVVNVIARHCAYMK